MKEALKKFVAWVKKNGFTSIALLGTAVFLFVSGRDFWATLVFGAFLGRNYEIIANLIEEELKKAKDKVLG